MMNESKNSYPKVACVVNVVDISGMSESLFIC
jgi:hypothetical protein